MVMAQQAQKTWKSTIVYDVLNKDFTPISITHEIWNRINIDQNKEEKEIGYLSLKIISGHDVSNCAKGRDEHRRGWMSEVTRENFNY